MVLRECGICQSSIFPSEQTTTCSKCGLTFHADCWQENWGCASYGCDQVNVLKPKEEQPVEEQLPPPIDRPVERLPWNFALLGAAAVSLVLSALAFGVPSLLVAGGVAYRCHKLGLLKRALLRNPKTLHRQLMTEPVLLAAAALALVGLAVGPFISRLWWFHSYTSAG